MAYVDKPFQERIRLWVIEAFGLEIANDITERSHRFLEEALETVQAAGCTVSEAHQLVDYVFTRPVGKLDQEIGGTIVTLAALCSAHNIGLVEAGELELERIQGKIDQIREKQKNKPKHSPLPQEREPPEHWYYNDGNNSLK